MTKPEFKTKLELEFDQFEITKRTLQQFKTFKLLNEAPEMILSSAQIRSKYKYRGKLEKEPDLKEKYYVWHLLMTLDTKWSMMTVEAIVTHFYARSKIINEILGEG